MGKIQRVDENIYMIPPGAFLRNRIYVYQNVSNKYVTPEKKKGAKKGTRGYTDHDSVCIGSVTDIMNPKECKYFYANEYYRKEVLSQELPEPPKYADSMSVGLTEWVAEVAEQSGLIEDLTEVFGEEETCMILDLAHYMLSKESAVMQHFPAWARDHVILSEDICSDTDIGIFLRDVLTISKINLFKEKWFIRNIGDGWVFLCYDSTNVNSQARGVSIVQKGHAKDDATLDQVNTDYVVRQSDGLPLAMLHSPGSVNDIAQAQEMIDFINRMKEQSGLDVHICLICDRGYISEKNLKLLDKAELEYILMLRTNFNLHIELADETIGSIRSHKNKINTEDNSEIYGVTRERILYEGGPACYAQVIWSAERYSYGRLDVEKRIQAERDKLEAFITASSGKSLLEEELKWIPSYFVLRTEPGEPKIEIKKKRGRGGGTIEVEKPTLKVLSYEDDEAGINNEYMKSGILVLITRKKMTAQETLDAYSKRDCVEKVFEALKSHLGMDKIGVTTEEAMHGKGLVWFIASIFHAILFNGTKKLRITNRKHYTVPAIVDSLEAIKADKNLKTNKYKRRYRVTARQGKVLNCWGITETNIDERIDMIQCA